ncbi:MAG: glycosyltransferase family 4 protein [Opitutaceae bacterium]|nr:glycosyltransferase family 4 protein [Cytophagales bacterium]
MSSINKILYISHGDYRSGAPILLLNLVRTLKELTKLECHFYIRVVVNALKPDFEILGPTFQFKHKKFIQRLQNKIRRIPVAHFEDLSQYDLIFSNTLTNGNLYPEIAAKGIPIITYVHELEIAAKAYTTTEDLEHVLRYTNLFAVPCEAVGNFLKNELGVPFEKIRRLDYYIPGTNNILSDKPTKKTFTVGASGTTDWRKGPDLFLAVAKEVALKYPDAEIQFLWKGATIPSIEHTRFLYEIKKADLGGKVSFEKSDSRMDKFYLQIDLFLLTSREDPYPLVVLEAASYQVPTVCFENSGGIPEFIELAKGGKQVPYLSVSEMAAQVFYYYSNRNAIIMDGKNAHNKLVELHQDKNRIVAQFENLLRQIHTTN